MRRWLALLAVLLSSLALVSVAQAPGAMACGQNNHCYGVMESIGYYPNPGVGGAMYLHKNCTLWAAGNNFINNELWVSPSGSSNVWIEAGYTYNGGIGFGDNGQSAFWEVDRPNGSFQVGNFIDNPANDGEFWVGPSADQSGPNHNFTMAFFGPNANHYAYSNDNSMSPNEIDWGSETTTSDSSSENGGVGATQVNWTSKWNGSGYNLGMPDGSRNTLVDTGQRWAWDNAPTAYTSGPHC